MAVLRCTQMQLLFQHPFEQVTTTHRVHKCIAWLYLIWLHIEWIIIRAFAFLKCSFVWKLNRPTQNDRSGVVNYLWPTDLDKERHCTFIDHLIWRLCICNCCYAMLMPCYWSRFEPAVQRGRGWGGRESIKSLLFVLLR